MLLKLRKIIVEESIAHQLLTRDIISRFPRVSVDYVEQVKDAKEGFKGDELLIAKQKGRFIKKCPGTPKYRCCDYYVLNLGIGCFFECTYCYLHYYRNSPLVIYVNLDDLVAEVKKFCRNHDERIIRLGSGEFIDSVGFDEIVNLNQILVPTLSQIANLIFEIKTKSKEIKHLLKLNHRGRVVVSWSVNAVPIVEKEEAKADSLHERLIAASLCQQAGYRLGFHFDPLIHYPGWEKGYAEVVNLIFKHIEPKNIAWISLGALRFNPDLKPIIRKKFPQSRLIYGELIPGLDGKLRYFIAIRRKMFATLVKLIRGYTNKVPIYLCMENKSLAEEVGAVAGFTLN